MLNILIVGGAGKTAESIVDLLYEAKHNVTIFDISKNNPQKKGKNIKSIQGDIRRYEEIDHAAFGKDIVIHLAINIRDTQNDELSFQTNVYGTYNVLRCAQKSGVKKVLIASSAPVHLTNAAGQCDCICSPGEDFTYDLTKNIQEIIAQRFSQTYAMNNLVLRLGHIVDGRTEKDLNGLPLSELSYCRGGWVCRYDVARAFLNSVENEFTGYHLANIVGSYQAASKLDLSISKKLINFECTEKFELY